MSGFKHRLNIYTCDECRRHIVTRDIEHGVSPFMIGCEATPGCKGMMRSSMYRVFDQTMAETHHWYRPESLELLGDWERDHVEKGGLLLRKADHPIPLNALEKFQ